MRFGLARMFPSLALVLGALSLPAVAAPVPVKIDVTSIFPAQTYAVDEKESDNAYLLVTGAAKGAELDLQRFPKEGAWEAAPKKHPVTEKSPLTLWKGELADGEFALLTVTLFQGKGADADKTKEFLAKLAAAGKTAPERGKKTLAAADFKALGAGTLKAHREVITKVKDLFSREKKTDHYGGQFTVIVWNNGGKLVKRFDPIGLTFGEHYGTDEKVYTKIKNSRGNVLIQTRTASGRRPASAR